jgi:alpha-glucosidase
MAFFETLRQVRMAGLGPALRTLRYTLQRDRLNGRSNSKTTQTRSPGKLVSTQALKQGMQAHFEHADLELVFLAPNLLRVSWQPGLAPLPYALVDAQWPAFRVKSDSTHNDDSCTTTLETEAMRVQVDPNGDLSFFRVGTPGCLRVDRAPTWQGEACSQTTCLPAPSGFFGLGERAASLELSGRDYEMWNSDPRGKYGPGHDPLYTGIPLYLALQPEICQLILYENSFRGEFRFDKGDGEKHQAEVRFDGGMLRYYLITGRLEEVYERYSQLTGCSPLAPRWALGYHQCRWGYKSAEEIRQVLEGFKQHQLPLSAIHLDIDYMDGYRVFTVDAHRFPDLAQLARELDQEGVKLVTILDPGVKADDGYPVYLSGLKSEVYCQGEDGQPATGVVWPGWSVFPDFTDPAARSWWGEFYRGLLDAGVAGFWHDMNEPTSFTAWGDMALPLNTRHAMEGRGGDHREGHNLYGLLMNRAGYEALQKYRPERRPWLLSRSGWAGLQRYAWSWTADVESSWPALQLTIATVLGMGLSGQPYCGPDIGGFSGNPEAELYLRWLQMAAFLPFCRTHSATGTARREPWVFGEPTTSIVRDFLELRYRLMPLLYSLAWQANQRGTPIVRPLFWMDPGNEELWGIEDEFLLGDNLLVAPVLEAGARSRLVRLPKGDWYTFWEDIRWQGPREVELAAPLERIPLLVKAGSLLPMNAGGNLALHVYPPTMNHKSETSLYSDAGDGYGPTRIDHFSLTREGKQLLLERRSSGAYPFPYPEIHIVIHGVRLLSARVDEREISAAGNTARSSLFQEAVLQVE